MENWKSIPGYEGHYEVSDMGNVVSLKRNKRKQLLKVINRIGYHKVATSVNGGIKYHNVHRLVLAAFIGESHLQVDHINGDKIDNRLENLRYCTGRENASFLNHTNAHKKTSKYKGVCWEKLSNKWRAKIQIKKKQIHLGLFDTEIEASEAYQSASKNLPKFTPPNTEG